MAGGEFQRRAQMPTRKLDDDWRDYWGKGQALRAAMQAQPKGGKDELAGAKKVLDAAALTYVAAAAMSALQLLRLVLLRNSRR